MPTSQGCWQVNMASYLESGQNANTAHTLIHTKHRYIYAARLRWEETSQTLILYQPELADEGRVTGSV